MAGTWSQRHFEVIADILADASYVDETRKEALAEAFGRVFAADNSRFKPGLFLDRALGAGNYSSRVLNVLREVGQR